MKPFSKVETRHGLLRLTLTLKIVGFFLIHLLSNVLQLSILTKETRAFSFLALCFSLSARRLVGFFELCIDDVLRV
jgi:hypothetical protein